MVSADVVSAASDNQSAHRGRLALLLLAFVAYGVLLAWHVGAYAGGSDSSGYLNNARLLREHRTHVPQRALPNLPAAKMPTYAYVPLGFLPVAQDRMVPSYPIGVPALVIATSWITGWTAAPHVMLWLHAMAGIALAFVLARQAGLPCGWSAFGALILAGSPLYVFMSLQAMSDVPALVWMTASVVLAWRSRRHPGWSLAAGAAFGLAVLVRPTNALGVVAIALALGVSWRRWSGWLVGGMPAALALAGYNRAAYGNALSSGYGSISELLTRDVVTETLQHYVHWFPVILTPVVICALGLPWLLRGPTRTWGWLLLAWIAAFAAFYTFYFHTHEAWWYLRFLLPACPALIVAALLVARRIVARLGGGSRQPVRIALAVCAVGFVAGWSFHWNREFDTWHVGRSEATYGHATTWALTHLPPNTVIAAMQTTGALYYYTEFTFVRWDQLQPADVAAVERTVAALRRPLVAMLFDYEQQEALTERMPGRWTKFAKIEQTTFWRWDGPNP